MTELDRISDEKAVLQLRVARDREELERATRALKRRITESARLGPYVGQDPYRWIAGAFALGFWIGWRRSS